MRTLRYPLLTLCLVLSLCSFVRGQAYIKLGGGYGFPLAGERLGTSERQELTTTLDPQSGFQIPRLLTENESVHGSYGAGLLVDGAFGYMFTDQLGVEGMISYVFGREYEVISSGLDSRLGQVVFDVRSTLATRSRGFFFAPMVKLTTGKGTIQPYLMAGPVIGKIHFDRGQSITTFDEGLTGSELVIVRYRGGLAKGARAVAGAEFSLTSSFRLFAEAVITGMNYYPKEAEVTTYEINGENRLPTLTRRQRLASFVNKVTFDTDDPIDTNDNPSQQPRVSLPLSSIAANVGVKYTFGY
ncbi:MAG: hypothetical protein LOY03_13015 [Cyclobacteriaceae bacterium]|nr:hypothetical protein [Cyclobacteriaceae bacterium]